ncbi:exonuclease SbcCD subunit D [Psychromicrobium lacuslunae]|uniref:Nuclease SbcCD subunit D n=1 Tax=Psychromicrobium lacuslunae TaxID=1618207 RepID=A0A0D4BXY4_9MICC|nr:exonuclease SbcCD subunit D [Psychromicrobium lacuslunae]AJT41317.1 exonuclease SbcD [Psychromicrobium lacuslunae]
MRLLHTSDWHLGRSFHGVGLLSAQRRFIDQLLQTVLERQVDVVLISGDVYDRALPGVDVVRLFSSALTRLHAAGATVVLSSGNHDSATRLGFAAEVLSQGGVHIRAGIAELDRPVLIDGIAIYGVPYLEPRLVAEDLDVQQPDHGSVMAAALDRIRADLAERPGIRSVVMAHTFASGALSSDDERVLSGMRSGGIGAVPLDLFTDFDYAALGHLHRRQQLSDQVRYSGSPLAYSFADAEQAKGGWLVEIDQHGLGEVEAVNWPAERQLATLRGELAELLAEPSLREAEQKYCQVVLTDQQRPARAMDRLRERFPYTLVLEYAPSVVRDGDKPSYAHRIAAATGDLEVCTGFLAHVRSQQASTTEAEAFSQALDSVLAAEVTE